MKEKWKITILLSILILVVVLAILGHEGKIGMRHYSESQVIAIFNRNQDKFFTAQEYIVTEYPYANLYFIDGEINEDEQTLPDDLIYIMQKLHFVSILSDGYEGLIFFSILGEEGSGILYIKTNDTPLSSPGAYYKKITDHWFYFEECYT